MTRLTPIQIDENTLIYIESTEDTIRTYTTYTLNAFRNLAIANIEEVTLQFGVEIGGEVGIPYITKGTAKSNLNITVKCTFPKPPNSSD